MRDLIIAGGVLLAVIGCEPRASRQGRMPEVVVAPVTRLGESAGDGVLADLILSVTRLADGRFVVYDWNDAPVLKLFDAGGAFLRTVGRAGQGPGEYGRPSLQFLRQSDGRLVVLDPQLGRTTVLHPHGFGVVSIASLPPFFSIADVVPNREGTWFLAAISFAESARGQPLHVVRAADVLESFGADPPLGPDWDSGVYTRVIAPARAGALWAARRHSYTIEKWDTTGTRLHVIERSVPWFPPIEKPVRVPDHPGHAPTPHIAGIAEDHDGRLWVAVNVPEAHGAELVEPHVRPDGLTRYHAPGGPFSLFCARIEVLDATTGALIADGEAPAAIQSLLGDGFAATPFLVDGEPRVQIWKLALSAR
jgi:hypothetical protein